MNTKPLTLAPVLHQHAATRPEQALLVCDADRLTYAEAERRSALLARGLIALGAGKGTHIGVLYPNGTDFLVAALAAARIGSVVIPFSTFATGPEMQEQLANSDIQILLATASYRAHDYAGRLADVVGDTEFTTANRFFCPAVPQLRQIAIDFGSHSVPHRARDIDAIYRLAETVDETLFEAMENDVDGADPLAIIYTSGSTSAPKGVVHTNAALLGHQYNLNDIRQLTQDDRLFCNSPFFWIGGFAFGLLAVLTSGATLVCSNATDATETLDLLEAERPTMTNGFAAGVAQLARHPSFPERDLSSIRRGNLYPLMPAELRPTDPELRHGMLGSTEAGSVLLISGDETDQPENRRGSFGKPAPGFETKIIDPDTGATVREGEIGELCIRGPYLMQGYYKRSREECFAADGWFHTGDLVRTDADGFVYFINRSNSMIKTAGANVSPTDVEKAIAKLTDGIVVHVVGIPDEVRGQVVAAVVVTSDPSTFDEHALRQRLRTELSTYKIPKRFATVAAADIPLLSSGKVDMKRLKKVFDA